MDWSFRNSNDKQSAYVSKHTIIPAELSEANWRVWAFIIALGLAIYLLMVFPVKPFDGYTDPFYAPTILILPLVGLFRITCYAYRKDYHRHIFKHPQACPVGERADAPERGYTGETRLFRFENLHRYFMYGSIAILPFFYYDFYKAVAFNGALTLAGLALLINTLFVTIYVFSCHALRHLTGGRDDCYSCRFGGNKAKSYFDVQSWFNSHHEQWAWISLMLFVFVDLYLRALAVGAPINATLLHI